MQAVVAKGNGVNVLNRAEPADRPRLPPRGRGSGRPPVETLTSHVRTGHQPPERPDARRTVPGKLLVAAGDTPVPNGQVLIRS